MTSSTRIPERTSGENCALKNPSSRAQRVLCWRFKEWIHQVFEYVKTRIIEDNQEILIYWEADHILPNKTRKDVDLKSAGFQERTAEGPEPRQGREISNCLFSPATTSPPTSSPRKCWKCSSDLFWKLPWCVSKRKEKINTSILRRREQRLVMP